MVYHASYQVNYKSSDLNIKITILRVRCPKCGVTHALKPHFLASRHQYDTFERQNFVLEYTDTSSERKSLRKLQNQLFPTLLVSHTVMYYWVRVAAEKKDEVVPEILKDIQGYLPSEDLCSKLLCDAEKIPSGTRNKPYSNETMKLVNWGRIYIEITSKYIELKIEEYDKNPYIYINTILSCLKSSIFL